MFRSAEEKQEELEAGSRLIRIPSNSCLSNAPPGTRSTLQLSSVPRATCATWASDHHRKSNAIHHRWGEMRAFLTSTSTLGLTPITDASVLGVTPSQPATRTWHLTLTRRFHSLPRYEDQPVVQPEAPRKRGKRSGQTQFCITFSYAGSRPIASTDDTVKNKHPCRVPHV